MQYMAQPSPDRSQSLWATHMGRGGYRGTTSSSPDGAMMEFLPLSSMQSLSPLQESKEHAAVPLSMHTPLPGVYVPRPPIGYGVTPGNAFPQESNPPLTELGHQLVDFQKHQAPDRLTAYLYLIKFFIYLIFLVVLISSLLQDRQVSHSFNLFRAAQRDLVTDNLKKNVNTLDHVLKYIQNDLAVKFLYGFLTWDNKIAPFPAVFGASAPLTTLRLRQHRVEPSCTRESWREKFGPCHPSAETAPLSKGLQRGDFRSGAETYSTQEKLCGAFHLCKNDREGQFGIVYPTGGYVYDLDLSWASSEIQKFGGNSSDGKVTEANLLAITRQAYQWIFDTSWVNEDTRALILEFTLMNANNPLAPFFASTTILFELPGEGGVLWTFDCVPLVLYAEATWLEFLLLGYSIGVMVAYTIRLSHKVVRPTPCAVCFWTINEKALTGTSWYTCLGCQARFDRGEFPRCPTCARPAQHWVHKCFWRGGIADVNMWQTLFNLSLIAASYIIRIDTRKAFKERADILSRTTDVRSIQFLDFGPIQKQMSTTYAMGAVNVFISILGLLAYLNQFETFDRFMRVFAFGIKRIMKFILTFFIAFVGFTLAFYLSLGTKTRGFNHWSDSFVSTFRLLVSDYSYAKFIGDSDALAGFLYFSYGVLMIVVATNVFISIVEQAYIEGHDKPDSVVGESMQIVLWDVKERFGMKRQAPDPFAYARDHPLTLKTILVFAKTLSGKGQGTRYSHHEFIQ